MGLGRLRTQTIAAAWIAILLLAPAASAQPVDIQAGNLIESLAGFKFPDGTIQTSAGGGASYSNVVVVAQSGSQFTSIQAAIDSITDAAASKPYLVWIAPGEYDENILMKEYVYLEGAAHGRSGWIPSELVDQRMTTIAPSSGVVACVTAASHSGLRNLRVECNRPDGVQSNGVSITSETRFNLTDVSIVARSGTDNTTSTSRGVFIRDSQLIRFDDVSVLALGAGENVGILSISPFFISTVYMSNVNAAAQSTFDEGSNWGIKLEDTRVSESTNVSASVQGGAVNTAVELNNEFGNFTNLHARANGGLVNTGLEIGGTASVTIRTGLIQASGGSTANFGITTQGTTGASVVAFGVQIKGATNTVLTTESASFESAHCHFDGGEVAGGGSEICRFSTDEAFAAYSVACPL